MADFRLAASSAAALASRAEELKYEAASVCVTVTSHVSGFPDCHGTKVRPSGRLPSDLNNPTGSLVTGMLACKGPRHHIIEYLTSGYAPRGKFACQTVKSARIHLGDKTASVWNTQINAKTQTNSNADGLIIQTDVIATRQGCGSKVPRLRPQQKAGGKVKVSHTAVKSFDTRGQLQERVNSSVFRRRRKMTVTQKTALP